MDIRKKLLETLDEVLSLGGRTATFNDDTPLLGAVPELDSMAVVGVIAAIEESLGVIFDDDEIDGAAFATFGSLRSLVQSKVAA